MRIQNRGLSCDVELANLIQTTKKSGRMHFNLPGLQYHYFLSTIQQFQLILLIILIKAFCAGHVAGALLPDHLGPEWVLLGAGLLLRFGGGSSGRRRALHL